MRRHCHPLCIAGRIILAVHVNVVANVRLVWSGCRCAFGVSTCAHSPTAAQPGTHAWAVQGASLSYFSGNYDTYKQTVEEQKTARAATRDALAKKHDKLQQSITAGRVQARRAGDSKKLVQMASKQKKLEERFGVETNEKGHRFKLNRDRAGYHNTLRDGVQDEHVDAAVVWKLPPPPVLRVPGPLIVIEGVGFAYPGAPGDVLADVSMTVERGSRVALIGKNGEGKTTLVRIMAGELAPRTGSVRVHPAAKVGFLRQNFVDDVRLREASALVDLGARYPAVKEQALYEQLGSFGLQGKTARQPLQSLSGGQAVRYAFACLMMESPHVLLLDEVRTQVLLVMIRHRLSSPRQQAPRRRHFRCFCMEEHAWMIAVGPVWLWNV